MCRGNKQRELRWGLLILPLLLIVGCEKEALIEPEPPVVVTCIGATPTIDYTKPSSYTKHWKNHNDYTLTWSDMNFRTPPDLAILDYNNDGYMDAVHGNSDYVSSFNNIEVRNKIQFFKGDCEGILTEDTIMSGKFEGPIHSRKSLVADFNGDGLADIFFIGHGLDAQNQLHPGEYPIWLLSNGTGDFTYHTDTSSIDFFHTGTTIDIDNDGDLDVLLPKDLLYRNNNGNLIKEVYTYLGTGNEFPNTMEARDIDNDSAQDYFYLSFGDASYIALADGTKVDIPNVENYSITMDIDFYDIDSDGQEEIIILRTGDGNGDVQLYRGWYIQILNFYSHDDHVADNTNWYIENNYSGTDEVIYWVEFYDKDADGNMNLFADDGNKYQDWEIYNGKLIRGE
jgi:hypothetical protein|tara:strand:- start:1279 stop:2469 length:1191 start_codon:yes stop_codon:yes gene_type:complete